MALRYDLGQEDLVPKIGKTMSTAISFQAPWVAPPTPDTATSRSVAAAATPTAATSTSTQSVAPQPVVPTPVLREETARDPSGLTVFRTVEIATGSLIAQFPTEAYLRLANAMRQATQPTATPGGPSDRTA